MQYLLDKRIDKFNLPWIPGHCSKQAYLWVTCVTLSNFYHFSPFPIYSLFTLPAHSINVPALHTKPDNTLPSYRAAIHNSNSKGAFGHRAILIWGDRGIAGGFLLEQPNPLHNQGIAGNVEMDAFAK